MNSSVLLVIWVMLSVIVAPLGVNRRIGYIETLFISLLFSPFIGAFAALLSRHKEDIRREQEILDTLKQIAQKVNEK